jgi:peptide/nickel transport system substrate-binding protein
MDRISRRQVVRGAAATAATAALGAPSVHAQKDLQTLRFIAEADLKVLDPIWNTAYITRNHGYLVYDTLFGTDENSEIKPQMVDRTTVSPDGMKYSFTLRDGLKWHDAQPVVSEDCVESLKRWGKKDRFGQLLMAHTAKIATLDKQTFTLELGERFGPVLEALGKPSSNVPFMMPARIAATPADEQIKEIVGSGPFKFARNEGQAGEQVVYLRNPDYVPRDEPPSGSTGGKKAYLDKVIWHTCPIPGRRRMPSRRARLIGGKTRRSTLFLRSNRTRICGHSLSIRSGCKAGSGRTGCTRRSTTRRRARRCCT